MTIIDDVNAAKLRITAQAAICEILSQFPEDQWAGILSIFPQQPKPRPGFAPNGKTSSVLSLLATLPNGAGARDIARELGYKSESVRQCLCTLRKRGDIAPAGNATWVVTAKTREAKP